MTRVMFRDDLIMWVSIEQLHLSQFQRSRPIPRISAGLVALTEEFGPLLPVCVRPSGQRRYEIVSNAETWLAVQRAGQHTVPITVHEDLTDEDVRRIQASELPEDPISEAHRFAACLEARTGGRQYGAVVELAKRVDRSPSYVAHALRLLGLPDLIQEALRIGALKAGHGKVLLQLTSPDVQHWLATQIISKRWSVRRSEAYAREQKRARPPIDVRRLERQLSAVIGSPAVVDLSSGELRIDYGGSLSVLDGILQRLGYHEDDF